MSRVLVTGASGLLAATLIPELVRQGYEVVGTSRNGVGHRCGDLAVAEEAEALLNDVRPGLIINLTAATTVALCERDPWMAYAANALPVENIVRWIASVSARCHLLHLSTDQVYYGAGPHTESHACPVNVYGFSKYAGELIAARVPSTVIRTNLFGKSRRAGRESLSDWLVKMLRLHEPARVFEDILFSPLSMATLAEIVGMIGRRPIAGTYNVGARGGMSKADFAFGLANRLGMRVDNLTRVRAAEMLGRARRPSDMRMDNTLFEQRYGWTMPTLEEEMERVRSEYEQST